MRSQGVLHHLQVQRWKVKVTWVIWHFCFCCVHSMASSLFDQITSHVACIQHLKGRCVKHHFQDERSKVKVIQVVWRFGLVRSVASSLFDWITSYVAYKQHRRGDVLSFNFQMKGQRSSSQRSFVVFVMSILWLPPYLTEPLHMQDTYNTWVGNVSHAIFRMKVKGQGHTGHFKFWPCRLLDFVPIWLDPFACDIPRTHADACDVSCTIFRSKDHGSRSHGLFQVLALLARWLCPYFTESPHIWHTYNTWRDDVSHTILNMKGQRSGSHRSFQILALFAPWLCPYLTESLHMWHTYNTWGDNVWCTIFRMKSPR